MTAAYEASGGDLPEGCPETLMCPLPPQARGDLHRECPDCRGVCVPVEIHPAGTRAALAESREREEGLRGALEKALALLDRWTIKANPVTAAHRHGVKIRARKLDDLCNFQIDADEARALLRGTGEGG